MKRCFMLVVDDVETATTIVLGIDPKHHPDLM
jgi:hypothetical protein